MHVDSPSHFLRRVAVLGLFSLLAGCGNGDGQQSVPGTPQPVLTGVLVDSPVSGVTWKTSGGRSGVTSTSGEFEYTQPESGTYVETVTFSIGDIVLGTVPGIPFKGERLYVSAVELTGSIDPLDRAATNQLVFIQSIDSDSNPSNGITISEVTQAAAIGQTLDFNSSDFATEVAEVVAAIAPGNAVVTDTAALDHFYTTYAALGGTDTFDWLFPGYPPVGEGEGVFQLVFADEFDSGDAPNPEVWNIDQGYGPNDFGWGNNEWQLYTDSPDNLRVEDGNLVITALCPVEPCGVRDGTITSGRITTVDKFEFKYGKVVARIKPPVGQGTWPAFWALGANFPEGGWPRSGEIDFMEVFNNTYNTPAESAVAERTATSAMHWCDELIVPDPAGELFPRPGASSSPINWNCRSRSVTISRSGKWTGTRTGSSSPSMACSTSSWRSIRQRWKSSAGSFSCCSMSRWAARSAAAASRRKVTRRIRRRCWLITFASISRLTTSRRRS